MEKKKIENLSPWVEFFCGSKENQIFCTIEKEFIEDEFNLICLNFHFSDLDKFLGMISGNPFLKKKNRQTYRNGVLELLYGLLHSRYIFTFLGIHKIFKKFSQGIFGGCPDHNCVNSNLLPFGSSDAPNRSLLNFFCPKCKNLFKNSYQEEVKVDSSFFGSSFLFFFLSAYPECIGVENFSEFVPRNFGFRFSEFYSYRNKSPKKIQFYSLKRNSVSKKKVMKFCCKEVLWYKEISKSPIWPGSEKNKGEVYYDFFHEGLF